MNFDLKEIYALIEEAAGMFSWAGETMEQMEALLETIRKETPECRVRVLAELGREVCDDRYERFYDLRDKFNCASGDLLTLLRAKGGAA